MYNTSSVHVLNLFTCSTMLLHGPKHLMSTVEKKTISLYSGSIYGRHHSVIFADATYHMRQYRACVM